MKTHANKNQMLQLFVFFALSVFACLLLAKPVKAGNYKWPLPEKSISAVPWRRMHISSKTDVDYLRFSLPKESTVTIYCQGTSVGNSTYSVWNMTKTKKYVSVSILNSSASVPKTKKIQLTLNAGTYYLRAAGISQATGDYRIRGSYQPKNTGSNRVKVSSITIHGNRRVPAGSSFALTATVSPAKAYNKSVIWTSGNSKIATVSSTGKVTTKKPGRTVIRATARDGSGTTRACTVIVLPKTMTLKSLSNSAAGRLTASWNRQTGVSGYQVEVKQNGQQPTYKFVNSASPSGISFKIPGNKTARYSVRVRAFITVNGKKYAGFWSNAKTISAK